MMMMSFSKQDEDSEGPLAFCLLWQSCKSTCQHTHARTHAVTHTHLGLIDVAQVFPECHSCRGSCHVTWITAWQHLLPENPANRANHTANRVLLLLLILLSPLPESEREGERCECFLCVNIVIIILLYPTHFYVLWLKLKAAARQLNNQNCMEFGEIFMFMIIIYLLNMFRFCPRSKCYPLQNLQYVCVNVYVTALSRCAGIMKTSFALQFALKNLQNAKKPNLNCTIQLTQLAS